MQHTRTQDRQRECRCGKAFCLWHCHKELVVRSLLVVCSFCSTEAHHRIVVAVFDVVVVAASVVAAACSFFFMLQHADALVAYTLSSD